MDKLIDSNGATFAATVGLDPREEIDVKSERKLTCFAVHEARIYAIHARLRVCLPNYIRDSLHASDQCRAMPVDSFDDSHSRANFFRGQSKRR